MDDQITACQHCLASVNPPQPALSACPACGTPLGPDLSQAEAPLAPPTSDPQLIDPRSTEPTTNVLRPTTGAAASGPAAASHYANSPASTPDGSSNRIAMLAVAAVVLAALGAGAYFLLRDDSGDGGNGRSVEAYCEIYESEVASAGTAVDDLMNQFDTGDPMSALDDPDGISASVVDALDERVAALDQMVEVAPEEIRPATTTLASEVSDQRDAFAGFADDPFGAITGLLSGNLFELSQAAEDVAEYAQANCTTE